jgi:hypothetical protein
MMATEDIWTSLSGISGSISLASWIVVLMPQLIENYRTKSSPPRPSPSALWLIICVAVTHWRLTLSSFGSLAMYFRSSGIITFV